MAAIIKTRPGIFFALALALFAVTQAREINKIHPVFPLLDANGKNVLDSGQPVSTMNTCGNCHDTKYIASHSYHVDAGFAEMHPSAQQATNILYPFYYEYWAAQSDSSKEKDSREWLKVFGERHVGGGLVNKEVEMNCFICHMPNPDNTARIQALKDGSFGWANTATLARTGMVRKDKNGTWLWEHSAFDTDGRIKNTQLVIGDPSNENCGQCHGLASNDKNTPVYIHSYNVNEYNTLMSGQIISSQKINASGFNLKDKESLARSWDIHAERAVKCVDCHFSVNNPVYYRESAETKPAHLKFDARRLDISDYLLRPSHQFAKGQNSKISAAGPYEGSMRRCESCHDAYAAHDWLPYKKTHFNALSCESCHIPRLYAPAAKKVDWTMLTADNKPLVEYRGIDGDPANILSLVEGYRPLLLPRSDADGQTRLAPYNLVSTWYWTYTKAGRQVPLTLTDLKKALFEADHYRADIVKVFDSNNNGTLDPDELALDTTEKTALVKRYLQEAGINNATIKAEILPYNISHDVTGLDQAEKDCNTCHGDNSRIYAAFTLAKNFPGGVMPHFPKNSPMQAVEPHGIIKVVDNQLSYVPRPMASNLYILGHDSQNWINLLGTFFLVSVLIGIVIHGGIRYVASRKLQNPENGYAKVYMYSTYERFWHWLQAVAIIGLIFTGLTIHAPKLFAFSSFNAAVQIHNILGFILLVNAFFSLFYHVAGGAIRHYLPEPKGFFNQAIEQLFFYVKGIFKGEEHPFEKTLGKKLNPLQKITYLVILNVLLPLQIIGGIVIWGAQRWPEVAAQIGGLPILVPLHSLGAWLFASFLIMHIYLTSTGYTVTSNIKAMVSGYDLIKQNPAPAGKEQ